MALGLGTGSLIAGIALGVVLTYRGSGVVDFSKGAVAIFIGYVFHELRTNGRIVVPPLPNPLALVEGVVNSGRSKPDWIDLPNWPTFIDLPGARQTFVSGPRHLGRSSPPCSASSCTSSSSDRCASRRRWPRWWPRSGCSSSSRPIILLRFGGTTQLPKKILRRPSPALLRRRRHPAEPAHPRAAGHRARRRALRAVPLHPLRPRHPSGGGEREGRHRPRLLARLPGRRQLGAGHRHRRPASASSSRPSPTLDPISVPLLIVPALGAALLGGFTSFGITVAAGLGIGMLQALDRVLQRQELVPGRVDPGRRPGQVAPVHRHRHRHVRAGQEPARAGHDRRRAPARSRRRPATCRPLAVLAIRGHARRAVPPRLRLAPGHHQHPRLRRDRPVAGGADRVRRADLAGPGGDRRDGRLRAVQVLQRLALPARPDRGGAGRRAASGWPSPCPPCACAASTWPSSPSRRRSPSRSSCSRTRSWPAPPVRSRCRHPRSAGRTSGRTTSSSRCSASGPPTWCRPTSGSACCA